MDRKGHAGGRPRSGACHWRGPWRAPRARSVPQQARAPAPPANMDQPASGAQIPRWRLTTPAARRCCLAGLHMIGRRIANRGDQHLTTTARHPEDGTAPLASAADHQSQQHHHQAVCPCLGQTGHMAGREAGAQAADAGAGACHRAAARDAFPAWAYRPRNDKPAADPGCWGARSRWRDPSPRA